MRVETARIAIMTAYSPPRAMTSYAGVTGNDEWSESGFYGSNAKNGLFAVNSWNSDKARPVRMASVTGTPAAGAGADAGAACKPEGASGGDAARIG